MFYGETSYVLVCMKEYLDIVDDRGNPTGQIVERKEAHIKGILHRTSHVWLVRYKENLEILVQKRSKNKDSFPDCFDISTAGHIPAGCDYIESAIREAKEELNIDLDANHFIYCGQRRKEWKGYFHHQPFWDKQISNVYAYFYDQEVFDFQKEEIQDVLWMDFNQCFDGVKNQSFKNCISLEELEMIQSTILK